jgi:hypothetical protein
MEYQDLLSVKDKLIADMLKVAKSNSQRFTSKIYNDKKLNINGVKVAVHVINKSYVEVYVISEGETILKVRHLDSFSGTINTVLNFININFL